MARLKKMVRNGIILFFLIFFLASCGTSPEPYVYEPSHELKPGRGLFSGEDGVFTILRVDAKAEESENGKAKDATESGDKKGADEQE